MKEQLKEWLIERKKQLIAGAAFVVLGLGIFFLFKVWWLDAPVKVARRFMDAALTCDTMGMYNTVDEDVLTWLKAANGADTAVDMEALAAQSDAIMAGLIQEVEDYGVEVTLDYTVTGSRDVESDRLAQLKNDYAEIPVDIRRAREVDVRVTATLTGEQKEAVYQEDLTLTMIQTPRGWGSEVNDNIISVRNLMANLGDFAWIQFG